LERPAITLLERSFSLKPPTRSVVVYLEGIIMFSKRYLMAFIVMVVSQPALLSMYNNQQKKNQLIIGYQVAELNRRVNQLNKRYVDSCENLMNQSNTAKLIAFLDKKKGERDQIERQYLPYVRDLAKKVRDQEMFRELSSPPPPPMQMRFSQPPPPSRANVKVAVNQQIQMIQSQHLLQHVSNVYPRETPPLEVVYLSQYMQCGDKVSMTKSGIHRELMQTFADQVKIYRTKGSANMKIGKTKKVRRKNANGRKKKKNCSWPKKQYCDLCRKSFTKQGYPKHRKCCEKNNK